MHADQDQHLAVGGAELAEGAAERRDLDHALLVGRGEPLALEVVVLDLGRHVLARDQAAEAVAEDGEQPGLEVGARRELALRLERVQDRVLDQVVGEVDVAAGEAAGERAQVRDHGSDVFAEEAHLVPVLTVMVDVS